MSIITSPQNPAIKAIRSLAERKYREETGLFVAEGEKVLARAKMLGWRPETVLSTGGSAPWREPATLAVTDGVMAAASGRKNPPSLLATFRQKWSTKVEPEGVWIALEDMRDPGNLGTIIRTADAAGTRGVILVGNACDPWGRECVRATMGSIFAVPLRTMTRAEFLTLVEGWPGEVVGTSLQGRGDYRRPYRLPVLLVMGSEGSGLSDEVAAVCSGLVRIPMREGIDSLNVAIASALMLFEIRRSNDAMDETTDLRQAHDQKSRFSTKNP
jgi:TrmH family RNA methyltransferase